MPTTNLTGLHWRVMPGMAENCPSKLYRRQQKVADDTGHGSLKH